MSIKIITRQLERAFTGPAWHGPSVLETLGALKPEQATHAYKTSHTVIQLIAHMATWRKFVIERLKGNNEYEVSDDMNFPVLSDLAQTVQQLKNTQQELIAAIQSFPEERLKEKVGSREYSYQTMLHGILHHDLYHLGQIVLLSK